MKKYLSLLLWIVLQTNTFCQENRFIAWNYTEAIKITGRVADMDSLCEIYWSGTSIKVNFEGRNLFALLKDQRGDNYYNIFIDGKLDQVLKLDIHKKLYTLAQNLEQGQHKLEIFKRTEWDRGATSFYGFIAPKSTALLPKDSSSTLKIEYFGNSITAGYAVDDTAGKDRPEGTFTNHYNTYAAMTARHFNAEHHCTCKSGIGVMISWFPLTMPQMYDRLNPEDSSSKWDFPLFTPDIVVINLLQNDSWLVKKPDYETFKPIFGNTPPTEAFIIKSYQNFVQSIRAKYPNSQIICMLGNMDITKKGSKWPDYVTQAVNNTNDPKVHTLFIPFKGTYGHPLRQDHQKMADSLIKFIEENHLNQKK